ncbi:hypothetical protein FB99_30830 [Pantoea agglomerans]|nr:hypothetical protein FB99_30830 [Pantoea agglomerans]
MSLLLTGWPRIKGLVLLASKLLHKLQDIAHQLSHAILC